MRKFKSTNHGSIPKMGAKFLASTFLLFSIFLATYAQSSVSRDVPNEFEFETAIYYGDSNVNLGEPFSITCIIPISDPIYWIKDGEPITRHNLRHGRDEHAYMLTESAIEGEKHKIEAHLTVRHALKVHDGKYQCNNLHSSYHTLHVRSPIELTGLPPNYVTSDDKDLPTQTIYESISDLTPSIGDDIFTRVWDEPFKTPDSVIPVQTQSTTTFGTHHQNHHQQTHHHHQQQKVYEEQQQQKHKLIYINTTNFDGNPRSASSSDENLELINLEYMPPTGRTKYMNLTTSTWKPIDGSSEEKHSMGHHRPKYSSKAPEFPPPRTTMLLNSRPSQLPPPTQHSYLAPIPQTDQHYIDMNIETAVTTATATWGGGYGELQPSQTQSQFPLQTLKPNYNHNQHRGNFNTMATYVVQEQKPVHTHHHHKQSERHHEISVSTPTMSSSSASATAPASVPTSFNTAPSIQVQNVKKEPDFLVPNYDNVEHQLKVYEIRAPLVLSCNITKEGSYELTWEKNGTDVSKVKQLEGRYRIIAAERKFIIDRTDVNDDGLYSCVADNQKKDINVVAHVVVRVPSNTHVVEGEKLSIVCTVLGTDPQLSWTIGGNLTINNSTGRYILKPDDNQVENAVLSVENVSLEDRGEFKCIGRNAANDYTGYAEASDVSFVRVKGKLAALWPFLGICAEVLILCTIILIYEKRRNKSELEESDTDPQEQKKKRRNFE